METPTTVATLGHFGKARARTHPAGRAALERPWAVSRANSAGESISTGGVIDAETNKLIDCPRACGRLALQNETHEAVSGEALVPHHCGSAWKARGTGTIRPAYLYRTELLAVMMPAALGPPCAEPVRLNPRLSCECGGLWGWTRVPSSRPRSMELLC